MHHHPLGSAVSILEVLTERPVGLNGHRLKNLPTRKSFPCLESLRRPFIPHAWDGRGAKQRPCLMLPGTLCLLRGNGAEDALQPSVHLTHPVGGGWRQRVQKHGHHSHVLAGHGEGGELPLRPFHCHGLAGSQWRRLVSLASAAAHSYVSSPRCSAVSHSMSSCGARRRSS
jgi:hypothetical protein